jgi:hypothetical protein
MFLDLHPGRSLANINKIHQNLSKKSIFASCYATILTKKNYRDLRNGQNRRRDPCGRGSGITMAEPFQFLDRLALR